jgi:hypothetical protein
MTRDANDANISRTVISRDVISRDANISRTVTGPVLSQ